MRPTDRSPEDTEPPHDEDLLEVELLAAGVAARRELVLA